MILLIIISLINSTVVFFISGKLFNLFQQSNYKTKELNKKIKNTKYNSKITLLSFLSFFSFCVFNSSVYSVNVNLSTFLGFIPYVFYSVFFFILEKQEKTKIKLKLTKRFKRFSVGYFICVFLFSFLILLSGEYIARLLKDSVFVVFKYSFICFIIAFIPKIICIVNVVLLPLEKCINSYYINNAKKKLDNYGGIKIAITGSYGKTSVKNILYTILSQKYKVIKTPESFNTPLGISRSVNDIKDDTEIFIAEMGARKRGDIKELIEMVKPDYSILTGINNQHSETFITQENIIKEKSEVFNKSVKAGFINLDSEYVKEVYKELKTEKYSTGESGDIYYKDISLSNNETKFTVVIGESETELKTKLLGKHNISNITLAIAVAYYLGLSKNQIISGVKKIDFIPHRLELIKNNNGVNIIDDGYNSNIDGVKSAVEVLKLFSGKKIVVTPGLIEQGEQYKINCLAGKIFSSVCDKVIIVGEYNRKSLEKGLIEGGKTREDIFFVDSLVESQDILKNIAKKGDVILFENDLPDGY